MTSKAIVIDQGAWSTSGNLFLPSTTGQRRGSGINIQAEFKKPGFYSVQFGIVIPPVVTSTVIGIAEIQWSVNGNTIPRLLNVYNGTIISGGGESVSVRLRDASENGITADPVKYVGIVSIIPGTRTNMANGQPPIYTPRLAIATTTIPAGSPPPYPLVPGESIDIPIPKNAGVNSMMLLMARDLAEIVVKPALLDNRCVQITQINADSGTRFNLLNYDCVNQFVPIAPGSVHIHVINTDIAGEDVWVTPIFGIEG